MNRLELTETIKEVKKAINEAENKVISNNNNSSGSFSEEFITSEFRVYTEEKLKKVSEDYTLAEAFLKDIYSYLNIYCSHINFETVNVHNIGNIIVAEASWHSREIEGKTEFNDNTKGTGGDFGLTISHPEIKLDSTGILIDSGSYYSGVLVQAKKQNKTITNDLTKYKAGPITPNQKNSYKSRAPFLSYLIYPYYLNNLSNFNWVICKNKGFDELKKTISNELNRTNSKNTTEVIDELVCGSIGTQDKDTIDKYILADTDNYFSIRIYINDSDDYLKRLNTCLAPDETNQITIRH